MKVFFSYGHDKNATVVADIKNTLEKISGGEIEVSIDTSTLRDGGMSWRQKLTQEILDSDCAVGFLSEYSSRERGVCLDELAIAIGCNNGMLHTVLLEPESKTKPSSLVSEYQWLDMSDYVEHTDDYAEYINEQAQKLYEILMSNSVLEYRREINLLRGKLSQNGNNERARFAYCLQQKMFGRRWIFEKLEELRVQPLNDSNRIVMLYGEPGAGKTMFSAHFQHYNPHVAAAVACDFQSKENSDVDSIILNIAYRIAMRIPEYRTLLCYYLSDDRFDMGIGKDRFEKLIVNPLGRLNMDGERENMYILIDALDEASGDAFASFLSNREYINMFSPWVRFLITARKEPEITERFKSYEHIDLEEKKEESNKDIQDFYEYAFSYMEQDKKQILIDRLVEVGGSNFFYASLVCEEITKDIKAGKDVFSKEYVLPLNMEELFKKTLDRKIGTEKFKDYFRKPLGMILASPEALPLELLSKIMDWDEEELNDFLEPFSTLLRINDEAVTVYHRSFAKWLNTTKTGYLCSKKTGLKNLTLGMYKNYKRNTDTPDFFTLQYLARMLLDSSKISDECKDAFEDVVENTSLLKKYPIEQVIYIRNMNRRDRACCMRNLYMFMNI